MTDHRLVNWLADSLAGPGFHYNPESVDWLFEPIRWMGVGFIAVLVITCIWPSSRAWLRMRLLLGLFLATLMLSVACVAVVSTETLCFIMAEVTEKQRIYVEQRLINWILEVVFIWSVAGFLLAGRYLIGVVKIVRPSRAGRPRIASDSQT
jgi:hypothetical protein